MTSPPLRPATTRHTMAPARLPALSPVNRLWPSSSISAILSFDVVEIIWAVYERFYHTLESDKNSIIDFQTQDIPSLRRLEERVNSRQTSVNIQATQSDSEVDVQQGGAAEGDQSEVARSIFKFSRMSRQDIIRPW